MEDLDKMNISELAAWLIAKQRSAKELAIALEIADANWGVRDLIEYLNYLQGAS